MDIVDDVLRSVDRGDMHAMISLDYSKAFDMINHHLLLSIFHYIGLGQKAIDFFKHYLLNRRQQTKVRGLLSKSEFVSRDPQGSICGPLLFIVYTSMFHKHLEYCKYHAYADDTQLLISFPHTETNVAAVRINSDVRSLVDTSGAHGLKINSIKSNVIVFGNRNHMEFVNYNLKIYVNNQELQHVRTVKNLGVFRCR